MIGSTQEDDTADALPAEDTAGLPAAPALPEAPAIDGAAAPRAVGADGRAAAPASEGRVLLHARLASWIQIRDASGVPILTRTLAPGDRVAVPDLPGLTLYTGNAGGLEIVVDGRSLPALGAVGAVRRNIALDPGALLKGQTVE